MRNRLIAASSGTRDGLKILPRKRRAHHDVTMAFGKGCRTHSRCRVVNDADGVTSGRSPATTLRCPTRWRSRRAARHGLFEMGCFRRLVRLGGEEMSSCASTTNGTLCPHHRGASRVPLRPSDRDLRSLAGTKPTQKRS